MEARNRARVDSAAGVDGEACERELEADEGTVATGVRKDGGGCTIGGCTIGWGVDCDQVAGECIKPLAAAYCA